MRTTPAVLCRGLFFAVVLLANMSSVAFGLTARATPNAGLTPTDPSLLPLKLASHIVDAKINGRVALVGMESVYHNDSGRELEATYVFPLPEGATIEKFVLWMDGQPVEAKVAEKERARAAYEGIVNRRKDPGLLEQVAENVFQYRIYPVPANGDQRVRIEYSQVLPVSTDSNTVTFTCPQLTAPNRNAQRSAASFVVGAALEMESEIAKIESPTHAISQRILPNEPKRGSVSIEAAHAALDRDFVLKVTLKDRAVPVTALAFRPAPAQGQAAEDGTLMLFITPQLPAGEEPPAKDVVLVMDTSGSMEGPKIEQARKGLTECLARLRPKDRFALISFSDFSKSFAETWTDVNADSLQRGKAFVNALQAAGGTNIAEALERATAFPAEAGRVKQILFATDGLPTVGTRDHAELCKIAVGKGTQRVHTFGIGYDLNTALLDKIAAETHGERAYVYENEHIDAKVGRLLDKISSPVLTDVTIEFGAGLGIKQVYPPKTNDLYLGQQVVLTARYKKGGSGQVVLKGKRNGKDVVIEAPLNLPETSVQATAFLPKQWALRKTGFLLDQMRLYGENAELKTEVVRLGTQFGIVTPYTSFLALEANDRKRFDQQTEAGKLGATRDFHPTDPTSKEMSAIEVPPDILAKAELGDHFETIDPDRPDTRSAFGNPDAHMFHSVKSSDDAVGGGGAGDNASPGSGGGWGGGGGTGVGNDQGAGRGSFGNRNGGGRRLMVKRHGGSTSSENSVDNALRWLAYHQEVAGHWDAVKFGAGQKEDVAVTSLALLAFLGAGHSEKVGEWKENVRRAVAWLRSRQSDDGHIADATDAAGPCAEFGNPHALAALALAEAAAMANVPETRAAAQKAMDYCLRIRTPDSGWGYAPQTESNVIATTGFVMALKSAKVAGLHVDPDAFDGAIKFLDSVERKLDGGALTYAFSAKENGPDPDAPRAAMGGLARLFLGWKKEDLEPTVSGFIVRGGNPMWSDKADLPYLYFGTLCAFQQGGSLWQKWNESVKTALLENSSKDGDDAGSWYAKESGANLGRVGQTALATLSLETYYRYRQLTPSALPRPTESLQPAPAAPIGDTGKAAVDYSEYIRNLKEGESARP